MNLINCVFLRRSLSVAVGLFGAGFLLAFLLGSSVSTDSQLLIGLGYLGLLMTVAGIAVLAFSAIITLLPGSAKRLSSC